MKVTWRVVYIIYATILLLVVGSLARQRQEQKYFESEGREALASSNELEKFYFFYGAMGYHLKEPTLKVENEQFELGIFEIYREEEKESFFYIMLHPNPVYEQPSDRILYQLTFRYYEEDPKNNNQLLEKTKTYDFDRFQNLDMYILVQTNRQALITTNEIQDLNPTHIIVNKKYKIFNEEKSKIEDINDQFPFLYTIKEKDLLVKESISKVGLDVDELVELGVYPKHHHLLKKYSYIFYLSITGAILAIILGAYFFFFFRRGRLAFLGKKKPTKAFESFGDYQEYYDPLAIKEDEEDLEK